MTYKLILAGSFLWMTSPLHAEFDARLGQVYNKSGERVVQRSCVTFDEASVQYKAPNRGNLSLTTNQSENDLRKSLGLGLEGSFQSSSMSISGKFSFLNSSAKSDYSQTLNMIYQETGAEAIIAPGGVVKLNAFGEETFQGPLAEQGDRCGHAYVGGLEYSSGILVNFTSNFASKSKTDMFEGWLEIIATYTFEGKFKSVLTELKEVGRFELNVYGWGRYADFVTTLLNPIQCNGPECGKLEFPGMEEYCKNNPEACQSLQALKAKLDHSILSCNTTNNPAACSSALQNIYNVIKVVQDHDRGQDYEATKRTFINDSVPTNFSLRDYIGSSRSDGSLLTTWEPRPLSAEDLDQIKSYKSLMESDISRYRRDINDYQAITSLTYVDVNSRRAAADEILRMQQNLQYLNAGIEACSSERVTQLICEDASKKAYQLVGANKLTTGLKNDLVRAKPFELYCEEVAAYYTTKGILAQSSSDPADPSFIISAERLDTMKYLINKLGNKSDKESDWEKLDCKAIASTMRGTKKLNLDGTLLLTIDPLLAQSQLESLTIKQPRVKLSQIPAHRFPRLRILSLVGANPQSYALIKNFLFLENLDVSETRASTLSSLNGSVSLRCLSARKSKIGRLDLNDLFNLEKLDVSGSNPNDLAEILNSTNLPYLKTVYISSATKLEGLNDKAPDCQETKEASLKISDDITREIICKIDTEEMPCD